MSDLAKANLQMQDCLSKARCTQGKGARVLGGRGGYSHLFLIRRVGPNIYCLLPLPPPKKKKKYYYKNYKENNIRKIRPTSKNI